MEVFAGGGTSTCLTSGWGGLHLSRYNFAGDRMTPDSKNLTKLLVIGTIFGIGGLCGYLFGGDIPPISDEVRFREVYMCPGPDPSTGEPLPAQESFIRDREKIFVCGYLETPVDALIGPAWFGPESSRAFYFHGDFFEEGYFFSELDVDPRDLKLGPHSVKLIYAHDTLAELEFEIR